MHEVVILGAARTPIGKYGGAFRNVHPAELGAVAARAALTRAGVEPAAVDDVWIGHGRQAGSGPNPARQVGYRAGLPNEVPEQTVNKACASGLQAVASGARAIALEEAEVVLVGGIESMSRMPYLIDSDDARWGHRLGHVDLIDAMYRDGFQCPLSNLIMGETAEVLARQYGISREESDRYALESQQRAEAATTTGRFEAEIAPVDVADRKGRTVTIARDEHPAMQMIKNPAQFDVIVTNNMFGDIVTDWGAQLQGGLGMAASGNLHPGRTSMFEPVHGSAPKYAGKNVANPTGAILSAALMLEHLASVGRSGCRRRCGGPGRARRTRAR